MSVNKGLSKSVEKYYNSSTSTENEFKEKRFSPIVAGLTGIARQHEEENLQDSYTGYLIEKYSKNIFRSGVSD